MVLVLMDLYASVQLDGIQQTVPFNGKTTLPVRHPAHIMDLA